MKYIKTFSLSLLALASSVQAAPTDKPYYEELLCYGEKDDAAGIYKVKGEIAQISVGTNGKIWAVNSDNEVHSFDRKNALWSEKLGTLNLIEYGNEKAIWGLLNNQLKRYDAAKNEWIDKPVELSDIPIGLLDISVDKEGDVWGIAENGHIVNYDQVDDSWIDFYADKSGVGFKSIHSEIMGEKPNISRELWALDNNNIPHRFTGGRRGWQKQILNGVTFKSLDITKNGVILGLGENGNLYRYDKQWQKIKQSLPQNIAAFSGSDIDNIWGKTAGDSGNTFARTVIADGECEELSMASHVNINRTITTKTADIDSMKFEKPHAVGFLLKKGGPGRRALYLGTNSTTGATLTHSDKGFLSVNGFGQHEKLGYALDHDNGGVIEMFAHKGHSLSNWAADWQTKPGETNSSTHVPLQSNASVGFVYPATNPYDELDLLDLYQIKSVGNNFSAYTKPGVSALCEEFATAINGVDCYHNSPRGVHYEYESAVSIGKILKYPHPHFETEPLYVGFDVGLPDPILGMRHGRYKTATADRLPENTYQSRLLLGFVPKQSRGGTLPLITQDLGYTTLTTNDQNLVVPNVHRDFFTHIYSNKLTSTTEVIGDGSIVNSGSKMFGTDQLIISFGNQTTGGDWTNTDVTDESVSVSWSESKSKTTSIENSITVGKKVAGIGVEVTTKLGLSWTFESQVGEEKTTKLGSKISNGKITSIEKNTIVRGSARVSYADKQYDVITTYTVPGTNSTFTVNGVVTQRNYADFYIMDEHIADINPITGKATYFTVGDQKRYGTDNDTDRDVVETPDGWCLGEGQRSHWGRFDDDTTIDAICLGNDNYDGIYSTAPDSSGFTDWCDGKAPVRIENVKRVKSQNADNLEDLVCLSDSGVELSIKYGRSDVGLKFDGDFTPTGMLSVDSEENVSIFHLQSEVDSRVIDFQSTPAEVGSATFVAKHPLANNDQDRLCYSFESADNRGSYLRHRAYFLYLDPQSTDLNYKMDATFCLEPSLNGNKSYVSFTSLNFPNHYLSVLPNGDVKIATDNGSKTFEERASFTRMEGMGIIEHEKPKSNNSYAIVANHSRKVLDVANASKDNGANVQQWDFLSTDNQRWFMTDDGQGNVELRSVNSGKYMDMGGWSQDNGGNLIQWDGGNGADNQKWTLVESENLGYYSLKSVHSGKCLDVGAWSKDNGANILQWDCHHGKNQQFKFIRQ